MKTKYLCVCLLVVSGLLSPPLVQAQANAGLVKERAKDLKKKVEAQRGDGKKPAAPVATNAPNSKLKPVPAKPVPAKPVPAKPVPAK